MMSVNRVKILTKRPSNENNFCIFFSLCFISISATSLGLTQGQALALSYYLNPFRPLLLHFFLVTIIGILLNLHKVINAHLLQGCFVIIHSFSMPSTTHLEACWVT